MSVIEIPAGVLAERFGEPVLLIFGLVCTGSGYLAVAFAEDFYFIVFGFLIVGLGAAFQHSLSSALITQNFDSANHRRALGVYNSFGDFGKLVFTGIFSRCLGAGFAWNFSVVLLSLLAIFFAASIPVLTKSVKKTQANNRNRGSSDHSVKGWGIKQPNKFAWLSITVFLDSLTQAVFLTFIAFVLLDKGAGEELASIAVVLALSGGMVGKFCCGFLAARFGDRKTFIILQILTVCGLLLLTLLSTTLVLIFLPLIGLAVQGSSTVTYGSVSEFIEINRQSRGYALIYTLSSGSAVVGPFLFGILADQFGLNVSIITLAILTCFTFPTSRVLRR